MMETVRRAERASAYDNEGVVVVGRAGGEIGVKKTEMM